ncbi:RsmB/NOP family class I SAM-dependent RNA methyltransferase [Arachidicoccus terrestris]|uniref:Fmu (Sun) domain protein n=1 Tax=Arachidicoccus terrestris TaxID=2875539 RepID=UPI001CC57423|nr:Fmu (Sun) domain protein [Arachidicoccus terrestris]UAY54072.1 Fmu (Sun) domain protein [Arachidicoccus terrestris]
MDPNKILDRQKSTVSNLLKKYDGKEPLHLYLKKYFAENRQHGSRDRKAITGLCYSYFRLGINVTRLQQNNPNLSFSEILGITGYIAGLLPWPQHLAGSSDPKEADSPLARFNQLRRQYNELDQDGLFPFTTTTSEGLDLQKFRTSMLGQPSLFIRIRPAEGLHTQVMQTLKDHNIFPYEIDDRTLALAPGTPVDKLLQVNKDMVIQDISSQRMAMFLDTVLQERKKKAPGHAGKKLKIWDCCAASGGKSLLAWDVFKPKAQKIDLTVSDIRSSILNNLDKRFKAAGITQYKKRVLDLLSPSPLPFANTFDLVICDVPCTGSGTWARNPENLLYFSETVLPAFYERQKRIVQKALQAVSPGGYFLYMTCSVFAQENELVTHFITQNNGMELVTSKLITGYKENGDSMFGALFTRTK